MTFSSYGCIGIGLIFYYRLVIVSFSIPYRLSSSQIEVVFFFLVGTRIFLYFLKG